ncbi:hypothetical protein DAPPUDRAFT_338314, partial [Daphnia pulex]
VTSISAVNLSSVFHGKPHSVSKSACVHFLTSKGLERELWFTTDKLIEMVPNDDLIIDVTVTDKYYNPAVRMLHFFPFYN